MRERERERERESNHISHYGGERVCSASVFKFPWLTLNVDWS